jgi:hypothetical protein
MERERTKMNADEKQRLIDDKMSIIDSIVFSVLKLG